MLSSGAAGLMQNGLGMASDLSPNWSIKEAAMADGTQPDLQEQIARTDRPLPRQPICGGVAQPKRGILTTA